IRGTAMCTQGSRLWELSPWRKLCGPKGGPGWGTSPKGRQQEQQAASFQLSGVPGFPGSTLMEERKGPGIWRHLYQFPLIESGEELFPGDLERHLLSEPGLPPVDSLSLYNDSPIVHKLS